MEPFEITVAVFDIDPAQAGRLSGSPTPRPIDWSVEPEFRQAVGEFIVQGNGRADVQPVLEATAQALNTHVLAGRKPISFEVHSVGRFGGHWGWSFTPAGYCRGCARQGRALDEDGYHLECRPMSRGAAKAFADSYIGG